MANFSTSALEKKFLLMCTGKGIVLESIFAKADNLGWYIDVTVRNRRFLFQTDRRDGYTFDERKGDAYVHYTLPSGAPCFSDDDKLLVLSLQILEVALADPEFRGYEPKII
jgi:hypothetical protein